MRNALLILTLAAALTGCASIRKGLGEYQKAADKGFTISTGPDAADGPAPQRGKPADLPGGLSGDKAHADYTAPRS